MPSDEWYYQNEMRRLLGNFGFIASILLLLIFFAQAITIAVLCIALL